MKIFVAEVKTPGTDNVLDCDYMVIKVADVRGTIKEAAAEVARLREKFSCANLTLMEHSPIVVSREIAEQVLGEDIVGGLDCDNEAFVLDIPDAWFTRLDDERQSIECSELVVTGNSFYWAFIPKHTEVRSEILPIDIRRLRHKADHVLK